MIAPSIDHYPFNPMEEAQANGRFDWTIAIEQRFPLSDIRTQRKRAAQADARRSEAEVDRVRLDVAFEAQRAYFMLRERREMELGRGDVSGRPTGPCSPSPSSVGRLYRLPTTTRQAKSSSTAVMPSRIPVSISWKLQ